MIPTTGWRYSLIWRAPAVKRVHLSALIPFSTVNNDFLAFESYVSNDSILKIGLLILRFSRKIILQSKIFISKKHDTTEISTTKNKNPTFLQAFLFTSHTPAGLPFSLTIKLLIGHTIDHIVQVQQMSRAFPIIIRINESIRQLIHVNGPVMHVYSGKSISHVSKNELLNYFQVCW